MSPHQSVITHLVIFLPAQLLTLFKLIQDVAASCCNNLFYSKHASRRENLSQPNEALCRLQSLEGITGVAVGLFFWGGRVLLSLLVVTTRLKLENVRSSCIFLSCFYFWNCSFCLLFIHMSMWETPCLNVPVPTQLTV